jgi:hypothetical protein
MLALNNAQPVPFKTYVTDLFKSENDEGEDCGDNGEDVEMNEVDGGDDKMAADNGMHVRLQQTSPLSDYTETESIQQPLKGRMSPLHLTFGLWCDFRSGI